MKIVYSLPHPTDQLDRERAGHIVRANALLRALERAGHCIHCVEAARSVGKSGMAAGLYRRVVKRVLPKSLALRLRDLGRITYGKVYADRLTEAVRRIEPDFIFETHVGFSLAGVEASKRSATPYVVDDISPPSEEGTAFGDGVGLKRTAEDVLKKVVSQATLVVAVSDHIRDLLVNMRVSEDKIVLIPNGFDGDAFHAGVDGSTQRAALGLGPDVAVIAFVGSFQRFHRLDLLIESFAALDTITKAHLLLIGDGPEAPSARAQLQTLGLSDRAHFLGRVPHAEVASYVAAADIAVLPGALDFGNSMKLLEYMALGKPTVAPDLQVISRTAQHSRDLLLFRDGSADELRKALAALVDNAGLRTLLSGNAAREAQGHTWSARAATLVTALRERRIAAAA